IIAKKYQHQFDYLEAKIGGAAYETYQSHCPDETLSICQQADAILFGSVGGPLDQQHLAKWQSCEVNSILKLRKHFDLGINIRPVNVYPELAALCPLKPESIAGGVDVVIFRELTGGIYFGRHKQFKEDNKRVATDECVYTEAQIHGIAHAAFQAAKLRDKRLCSVDKANVLATSKLWREVVSEIAKEYPEVKLSHMLVDNCAMQVVLNPKQFDVIVTENMFGDIISDLCAALPGSLGLIPSASLNNQGQGLYEPSGGSAPDIAGKNIANPAAQILSAALLLRYSFKLDKEAKLIEEAIKTTISSGILTADLAKNNAQPVSTTEFVDAVIKNIY
ncbi:MAG: 3-isopropylmalate dehydrogenase, partial [Gammaproteobacteria bacterium]|nr:3-isopropylmalate dehydrogenase [Gammaproteobacteria bacterium]